ncbi:hypothetical protein [Streptomyces sp. TRM64462]|uniref:hypothetical protein n=1 Tax=Streptomyces sp. TRM64462 TaxID=2741726 RepID=UPI001586B7BB|nr:hypothetical protein [Streptomyces sp. TRM64462]
MANKTTMDGPVHLRLPVLEPVPVEGCAVCTALAGQQRSARRAGDLSAATDCNVRIRNHPHARGPK